MTTEKWRAIPEHEHYEVSNIGRVRSVDRTIMKACGPCKLRGKILSQFPRAPELPHLPEDSRPRTVPTQEGG